MDQKAQPKAKVAVGVSGSGRSLANLLAQQEELAVFQIVGVIASRSDCPAIKIAAAASLPVYCEDFPSAKETTPSSALLAWLESNSIEWIVLAGFLRMFPTDFPPSCLWAGRVINIHPALLPKFGGEGMYGAKVHAAVLAAGALESGASVHFATADYDAGQVLAQQRVRVFATDSPQDLAKRVFAAECQLLPLCLADLVRGKLPLARGQVYDYTKAPTKREIHDE